MRFGSAIVTLVVLVSACLPPLPPKESFACLAANECGAGDATVPLDFGADLDGSLDALPATNTDAGGRALPTLAEMGNVIWLTFDGGNFADHSGHAHRVMTVGAPILVASSTDAPSGGFVKFDPSTTTNDGFEISYDSSMNVAAGKALTIEAWVYRTQFNETIVGDRGWDSAPPLEWELDLNGGTVRFFTNNGCGDTAGSDGAACLGSMDMNRWTHLAVTWNGVTVACYKDGRQFATHSLTVSPCATTRPRRVGVNRSSDWDNTGRLDEIKVSNWVKSPDDIVASMNFDSEGL